MSRRHREEEPILSLDSFLDIVTNVVGVLILVAVVTVLGTGDIGVSAGASALAAPKPHAQRALFECSGDEVFFVDEVQNGWRVQDTMDRILGERLTTPEAIVSVLDTTDIGDRFHRVQAELVSPHGLTWVYTLRSGVRGEGAARLDQRASQFQRHLDELPPGGFAYFVVHDDSFDVFRKARDIARARGISIGWHPVEGRGPVRFSGVGSLGKRVQ